MRAELPPGRREGRDGAFFEFLLFPLKKVGESQRMWGKGAVSGRLSGVSHEGAEKAAVLPRAGRRGGGNIRHETEGEKSGVPYSASSSGEREASVASTAFCELLA